MKSGSRSGGVVYTPPHWADWAVLEYRIDEKWMKGDTVLDTGCGRGALIESVIRNALAKGYQPNSSDLERLRGIDTDAAALAFLGDNIRKRYGISLPETSLRCEDFLLAPPQKTFDIILANPPWLTFGDLDERRKNLYKPLYRSSGLTPRARDLLLGGSRIDLAALFIITALGGHLAAEGEAYFFIPLSLYRSEGAHSAFRRLRLPGGEPCALTELRELDGGAPFPGAGTQYGFASYRNGQHQKWPVPWYTAGQEGRWKRFEASPVDKEDSPLRPYPPGLKPPQVPRIPVPSGTLPRQGANPCGAAEAFILEEIEERGEGRLRVRNKKGMEGILPGRFVHPLMSPDVFQSIEHRRQSNSGKGEKENLIPRRWIFLPYTPSGKILDAEDLEDWPDAREWLERHRSRLETRKGVLMARWKERNIWWAMLGVGPYCFAPWKIAWEAYGRTSFAPRLFECRTMGHWQGNQALHAYLPFSDEESARKAYDALSSQQVGDYLRSLGGAGTKLWAQPGRIKRLLWNSESIAAENRQGHHVVPGI